MLSNLIVSLYKKKKIALLCGFFFLLIILAATFAVHYYSKPVLPLTNNNNLLRSHTWRKSSENMTYTRVNIQSNHFYEIILKCKRESELSFNDANLMLIADLFDEDYDDNAAEIRVLSMSLTEQPKVFSRAFHARYTGRVSFRLFNKTGIPVEISYIGFHEIKSAKRFLIFLKAQLLL